ncbi:molybdopterin-dependent oxidoreductase [Flavobacteriaceae bacterium XHP0103]|uniref:molybdopterin-dependent oxidoreductase n=1 Tax=Marixanthotalea marina TaxID=2844359 RepID=UPI002989A7E4|nr:molybdopterin-dependent oxidoreductase [Marixanthotalea marina]MBU3821646.1 molybdopterin-dependent oxidoreductase [Marixanthotalea marina]
MYVSLINRRSFVKKMAIMSAMTAAASMFPGILFAGEQEKNLPKGNLDWKKAPCRFCGVGCGVLVGIDNGKAVAVKGDPNSPVNKGLCCVKGYHSVMALYGKDRLTKPLVKKNGRYVETSMKEALDLVASKMQETIKDYGKDAVSIYGSGQWTIPDGYVASKLFKGCIGTNNVEANARLCMASAVTGFLTSFGIDEPMGCYEDIDHANVFVLWGNNMAEMHPVLFSRLLDQRLKRGVKIIDFATRTTRTSMAADKSIIFKPNTDLAVANAICYEIIENGWVNQSFVEKYCNFSKGLTNMGYGLEDNYQFNDKPEAISFKDFKTFLKDYTPEKVEKISGVSAKDIKYMASHYGNPNTKVMSLWCMGPNQHTRGTWMNNLIYNIHLLTGKISTPGNSPFSLTGQPSACGTVREVGTLTHKLPHGVVTNEEDRKHAAEIWNVPVENISPKPTYHTVEMFRALDRGDIRFMWIQVTNPMVTMPKLKRYRDATKKEGRFIVVSDVYPTPTTDIADVILPSAMWIEREGMYGNSERRTQYFEKMVEPLGEAVSDTWQLIEVARRLGYERQFYYKEETHIEEIYNEYSKHHEGKKHGMAPLEVLKSQPGAQWPYVEGKSTQWRFNAEYDPACSNGEKFHFYGKPDGKAVIWQRPYEPAPEEPDNDYPFWLCTGRVVEHWHTGSMTRRIPVLHKAMPNGYVELNPGQAKEMQIKTGDKVRVSSRRGEIVLPASVNERGVPERNQVFVPFFDENMLINDVTLDAFCPISKQPDYKKCAVKIEKV